jgi:ribosomal protein L37E
MSTRIIKCSNCGVFNTNKEYCDNCGTLISDKKKRELKELEVKEKQIKEVIYELEHPSLAERLKKHPNFFYKIAGWVLYSIISIVTIIGSGLAWFIAMVAAG